MKPPSSTSFYSRKPFALFTDIFQTNSQLAWDLSSEESEKSKVLESFQTFTFIQQNGGCVQILTGVSRIKLNKSPRLFGLTLELSPGDIFLQPRFSTIIMITRRAWKDLKTST